MARARGGLGGRSGAAGAAGGGGLRDLEPGGGFAFRPAAPGEAPDILIGAQGAPERVAFANVWHGDGRAGRHRAADPRHDLLQSRAGLDTGTGPLRAGRLDLETVLAHEIGHAIGLDHPGATGALMGYSNQGSIDHLMPGDIAGAVALYGPAKD